MLLAVARPVLAEGLVDDGIHVGGLGLDQPVDAIERDATVVADDASATVGVGQPGEKVRAAGRTDARGVDVEDRFVVGLAVLGEDLLDLRVRFEAGLFGGGLDHAPAAGGHHGPLQRLVGLQADDDVVAVADEAGGEGVHIGGDVGFDVVDALLTLHAEIVALEGVPDLQGLVGRAGEERCVPGVGGVVAQNEIAYIDAGSPKAFGEAAPGGVLGESDAVDLGGHWSPSLLGHGGLPRARVSFIGWLCPMTLVASKP